MRGVDAAVLCWVGVSLLSLFGLGLATYLAVLYVSDHPPACGPCGGCEAVTTSEYARFLRVPVTVLGVGAYSLLLLGSLAVAGMDDPPPG